LGANTKEMKPLCQRDIWVSIFIVVLLTIAKT
jgi:hypothetical protein